MALPASMLIAALQPAAGLGPHAPAPYSTTPAPGTRAVVWVIDNDSIPSEHRNLLTELIRRTVDRSAADTGISLQSVGGSTRVGPTRFAARVTQTVAAMSFSGRQRCRVNDVAGTLASVLSGWGELPGTVIVVASSSETVRTRLGAPCALARPASGALRDSVAAAAAVHIVQVPDASGSTRARALRELAAAARGTHAVLATPAQVDSVIDRFLAHPIDSKGEKTAGSSLPPLLHQHGFVTDVRLNATAFVSAPSETPAKVLVAFAPVDPSQGLSGAVAALLDQRGRVLARWNANDADLRSTPVLAAFAASPGSYRARVCANAGANVGCVDHEFDVAAPGQAFLSSLVLGVWRDGQIEPRLDFRDEAAAAVYAEVEGWAPGPASCTLVVAAQGGDILDLPGASCAVGSDGRRGELGGELPVAGLPPGDYLVTLRVASAGGRLLSAMRTLRKVE